MLGRAKSTMPNRMDTRPPTMNSARVPAVSPLWNAAKISKMPPTNAQIPMTSTSTSAVGPGQTSAMTPAARAISASSRWPNTGPAVLLLNAHRLQPGVDERVDREQDDERQDRHVGPGDGDDPDDD